MREEVYCLPCSVCCAGGLIGQLPGEDSGVLTVASAIHRIDPGQDRMDVVLVSLCMHKACQPCLCVCTLICPSLHCEEKKNGKEYVLCHSLKRARGQVMLGFFVGCTAAKRKVCPGWEHMHVRVHDCICELGHRSV